MGSVVWSRPKDCNSAQNHTIAATENVGESDNEKEEHYEQNMETFEQTLQRKKEKRLRTITKISEKLNELRNNVEDLEKERTLRIGLEKQVETLKQVSAVSNKMLQLRETEVNVLKKRLYNFETITDLRHQYENEIENIRRLQALCEERTEAEARARQNQIEEERSKNALLELKLSEYSKDAGTIQQLKEKVDELEKNLIEELNENKVLTELRNSLTAERNMLTSQLKLINNLFSNMLSSDNDFDFLIQLLRDYHNLIVDLIVHEDINDTISLLINYAKKINKNQNLNPIVSTSHEQNVVINLPKVWRILVELLGSYDDAFCKDQVISNEGNKKVNASTTPKTSISVRQIILCLKDLISEKSSLINEINRLKTLKQHVETRLNQQEKRLEIVLPEIKATWCIVGKLQVQHKQLHNHQKILSHELQHKRQMLTELKQELNYCRKTWNRVKDKNNLNEHDFELLQIEFAFRKSFDKSNSVESGYDEEDNIQCDDSDSASLEKVTSSAIMPDGNLREELKFREIKGDVLNIRPIHESAQPSTSTSKCSVDNRSQSFENALANTEPKAIVRNSTDQGDQYDQRSFKYEPGRSHVLDARATRLRLLDQQCQSLLNQMALTSLHSDTLSCKLEKLHEKYGSEERRPSQSLKAEPKPANATNEESSDLRQVRVQQMEQTYMEMIENAVTGYEPSSSHENDQNPEKESTSPE